MIRILGYKFIFLPIAQHPVLGFGDPIQHFPSSAIGPVGQPLVVVVEIGLGVRRSLEGGLEVFELRYGGVPEEDGSLGSRRRGVPRNSGG